MLRKWTVWTLTLTRVPPVLKINFLTREKRWGITDGSGIDVAPANNFSKVFHPDYSYSNPPEKYSEKYQGQNVLCHQRFSYQQKK